MAKKNEELAPAPKAGELAPAASGGTTLGIQLSDNAGRFQIGRMALYQGTTTEQATYPDAGFRLGDFIDCLEVQALGQKVQIIPCVGWPQWVRWDKGQNTPTYVFSNREEAPAEDLQWTGDKDHREPPAAATVVNYVCLVKPDGKEWSPYPFLVQFKRTSFPVVERVIEPLENRGGPRVYELSSEVAENSAKQKYRKMRGRSVGMCPDELKVRVNAIRENWSKMKDAAEAQAKAAHGEEAAEPVPF